MGYRSDLSYESAARERSTGRLPTIWRAFVASECFTLKTAVEEEGSTGATRKFVVAAWKF